MAELLLIARLVERRIAFPAAQVEAVVELEGITPVPGAPSHVAGLSALRSRVLTVIDSQAALGLPAMTDRTAEEAIVVSSGGHTYALLVDGIEDVVEAGGPPDPVQASPGDGWSRIGSHMIEADGDLLLLADPQALIGGPVAQAA